ncbi:LD-carboxypeptidase [Sphingomonas sp. LaA6.9]|uniref:LD-carboxypeptidase n=1 Tax=Sphingomonas sp. LaA6.9 TaxID=2919914 RepID=UPI001F4F203F|nr:LD-carboxypeptidase [Sphingomonas sp. LaA6.9]MCJ8157673.1 LD-carboxypeptidase [Sphingomonas sp. LaA6.9]
MKTTRIGVVAPSCPIDEDVADRVVARARALYGESAPEIRFHPQCFLTHGHFAGDDAARADAFVAWANDPEIDAIWFARGGYGSCRIAEAALPRLNDTARAKQWLGYSDAGTLLGALYGAGFDHVAHGPMPADIRRAGGDAAIDRALSWLVERSVGAIEPNAARERAVAFNMTILSNLIGTPFQPDLSDHVMMLEEVSEHHYRIDRTLFHITSNPEIRRVAGIRIGRVSDVIENDRPFGYEVEEIVAHWCAVSGIPLLGTADIGHDAENRVVPFGGV